MKKILISISALMLALAGCESDLDTITVEGLTGTQLLSDGSAVELSAAKASVPAVTFTWDDNLELKASVADAGITAEVGTLTLEIYNEADADGTVVTYTSETGVVSFTHSELNSIASELGITSDETTTGSGTLCFRVASALGGNTAAIYSNVVSLKVSTYYINMHFAEVLDASEEPLGVQLYSANADGVYTGFVGATGWMNWYMQTGDGYIWGNENTNWTPFEVQRDGGNFWYPEPAGCYYTTVNTNSLQWTATYINSLAISLGSENVEMTYIRAENRWMAVITTTEDNQTFGISGTYSTYNKAGGDGTASETGACTFGATDGNTLEWNGTTQFTVPAAGDYTVSLLLNTDENGKQQYTIKSGAEEIEETAPAALYMIGLNDVWDFNFPLACTSPDDWTYTGVFGVNSCPWGYYLGTEVDNWGNIYQAGETDGTLSFQATNVDGLNVEFGNTGVYIWDVDLKNLTYTTTEVTSVSYAGFNDNWDEVAMTQATNNPNVYYADITITQASEWGGKFFFNGNWDLFVGGSDSKLVWGKNCTADASLDAGSYTIILDFAAGTVTFSTEGYDDTTTGDEEEEEEATVDEAVLALDVTSVYYTGFDDEWTLHEMTQAADGSKVWTATVTLSGTTTYGPQIFLGNSWDDTKLGGKGGYMSTTLQNFTDITGEMSGTYTFTVNFVDGTYTFEAVTE